MDKSVKEIIEVVKGSADLLGARSLTMIVNVHLKTGPSYGKYFPLEVYVDTKAAYLKFEGERISAKKMQAILDKGRK